MRTSTDSSSSADTSVTPARPVQGNPICAWFPRSPQRCNRDLVILNSTSTLPASIHSTLGTRTGCNTHGIRQFGRDGRERIFCATGSTISEWLQANQEWKEWFCYVDSFDLYEPFHVPEPYASMYTDEDPWNPELTNWPYYGSIDEGKSELTDRKVDFVRSQFARKTTMVDQWIGYVFDTLDRENLWDETMVIVTSDHGHYHGDHGWMGKPTEAPVYDVLANVPLLVWHPDSPWMGKETSALTSAVDLYGTILDAVGIDDTDHRHTQSLMPLLNGVKNEHRDWSLHGYWGTSVNLSDGQYTYLHPCDPDIKAHCHSTIIMDAYGWFTSSHPKYDTESRSYLPYAEPPVWRFSAPSHSRQSSPMLFDVTTDPDQTQDLYGEDGADQRMQEVLRGQSCH